MIDAVDLVLTDHLENPPIEFLRGSQVMAERFFDDNAAKRIFPFFAEPALPKMFHYGRKEAIGDRQIEHVIATTSVLFVAVGQLRFQLFISGGVVQGAL